MRSRLTRRMALANRRSSACGSAIAPRHQVKLRGPGAACARARALDLGEIARESLDGFAKIPAHEELHHHRAARAQEHSRAFERRERKLENPGLVAIADAAQLGREVAGHQ